MARVRTEVVFQCIIAGRDGFLNSIVFFSQSRSKSSSELDVCNEVCLSLCCMSVIARCIIIGYLRGRRVLSGRQSRMLLSSSLYAA
jgi:hypothetical protein